MWPSAPTVVRAPCRPDAGRICPELRIEADVGGETGAAAYVGELPGREPFAAAKAASPARPLSLSFTG